VKNSGKQKNDSVCEKPILKQTTFIDTIAIITLQISPYQSFCLVLSLMCFSHYVQNHYFYAGLENAGMVAGIRN
jgi:hypothetical protein